MMDEKLSSRRTISQAPLATSVPVIPMAKPTSALVKAGASLVPSPVTATTPSDFWIPITRILLSSGEDLARTLRYYLISLNFFMFLTQSSVFGPAFLGSGFLPSFTNYSFFSSNSLSSANYYSYSSSEKLRGTSISPPTSILKSFPFMQEYFWDSSFLSICS